MGYRYCFLLILVVSLIYEILFCVVDLVHYLIKGFTQFEDISNCTYQNLCINFHCVIFIITVCIVCFGAVLRKGVLWCNQVALSIVDLKIVVQTQQILAQ